MPEDSPLRLQWTLTHGNSIYWAAFADDGERIATASLDNLTKIWSRNDGRLLTTLTGHRDGVTYVRFLGTNRILTGSLDRSIRIWDITTGSVESTLSGHQAYLSCAAVSRNLARVASGGFDKTVLVFDVASSALLATLTGHEATVQAVALSSDGQWALSGGDDLNVRLWNVNDAKLVRSLSGHTQTVEGVVWAPDDRRWASVSGDGTLRTWDAQGTLLGTARVPKGRLKCVAFSQQGQWLATGGSDGAVRIWAADTLKLLHTEPAHRNTVYSVQFASEDRGLVSAGFDRQSCVWQLAPGSWPT